MSQPIVKFESKSHSLFPSDQEWALIRDQASTLVKSGLLPSAIKTPEQAIAIALKGREMGIPMMQAFAHINIVQGKPCISSELMLALIFRNYPGAFLNYVESSNTACVIEAKRPHGPPTKFSFTLEDAKRANLTNKDNWRSYPSAMLRARTIAIMARALFPDALMGCSYTPEEMGAEVTDEGEVIALPPEGFSAEAPKAEAPKLNAPSQNAPGAPQAKIIAPVRPTPQATQNNSATGRSRRMVGQEIHDLGVKMGLSDAEIKEWALEAGCAIHEMSLEGLDRFLAIMKETELRNRKSS